MKSPNRLFILVVVTVLAAGCRGPAESTTGPSGQVASSAAALNVTGVVRDIVQHPIGGASVVVTDGLAAGLSTTTDPHGQFALTATTGSADVVTVAVSKEGYAPANVRLRNNAEANILLRDLTFARVEGPGTLTIVAESSCSQLPTSLRGRTYRVLFGEAPTSPSALIGQLSGADFYDGYGVMSAYRTVNAIRFALFSWDAYVKWLDDLPIIERLTPTSHLSFSGSAVADVDPGALTITGAFDGTISFCAESAPPTQQGFPPTCKVPPVECKSTAHRLTFTRDLHQ